MDNSNEAIPTHVLPSLSDLAHARSTLHHKLPTTGQGLSAVQNHLVNDIVPALNSCSRSSRYYGFVTGGAAPAAHFADNLVTEHDQNVQVHLPNETIATNVEAAALDLVCDLIDLNPKHWTHRTFTTGATASNIIGLACGREHVLRARNPEACVSSLGLMGACQAAGITEIQILTTAAHSSLRKSASVIGLGHTSVKDVSSHHMLNITRLEELLKTPGTASIIAVSCAEVNSGFFATFNKDMADLRALADKYKAWIHIDAAFGLMARILPKEAKYATLLDGVSGIEHADSITADGHKLLNVPYDCGIFLSRHLATGTSVFQNPGAPYLNTNQNEIPSPLNIGIENSRRFRALPVYANLIAYGKTGFQEMLERQIELSRTIASWIDNSDAYELLPFVKMTPEDKLNSIYIIVLFRAKDPELNVNMVKKVNETRQIYISGTKWQGKPAARFAVSNWKVDVKRDFEVIKAVLEEVAAS